MLGSKGIREKKDVNEKELEKMNYEELIAKLFEKNEKGITMPYECTINSTEDTVVSKGNTHMPYALEERVDKAITELLERDYIQESSSNWVHRLSLVEKDNGTIRITTNFIKLN